MSTAEALACACLGFAGFWLPLLPMTLVVRTHYMERAIKWKKMYLNFILNRYILAQPV